MSLFGNHQPEEQANSLAAFMPTGKVFSAAGMEGTNLRNYLIGLGAELYRVENLMNGIINDYNVNNTVQFISEWEAAMGIPDSCLTNTGNLQQRRANVIAKLAKMNIVTANDFINLAQVFGVTIYIKTGTDLWSFPLSFPINITSFKTMKFTLVVDFTQSNAYIFPLLFPFGFSPGVTGIIQCLFNKLKPANVQVIYRYGQSS